MFSSLSFATSLSLGFRCSPPLRTPTLAVASSLPPLSNLRPISCNSGFHFHTAYAEVKLVINHYSFEKPLAAMLIATPLSLAYSCIQDIASDTAMLDRELKFLLVLCPDLIEGCLRLSGVTHIEVILLDSRLTGAASSSARRRAPVVFASDSSSSGPEASAKGKVNKSNEDGPPLLTVLAAVVVFLLFCWIVGSIVVWLVGLITNAPRS